MAWSFGNKNKSSYSSRNKKTFGQRMNSLKGSLKKAFIIAVAGTATIGGPGYYYYGTTKTQEVKVTSVDSNYVGWNDKTQQAIYDYKVTTDHGVYENKNTYMHMKFDSDELQNQIQAGKIYQVKSYGERFNMPFGIHNFFPNIVSAREITPAEIKARDQAKANELRQQQQAQHVAGTTPPTVPQQPTQQNAQPAGLSGQMITYEVIADGERVQMTVPVEAAGKVVINTVKPLVPPVAPKPPGQ